MKEPGLPVGQRPKPWENRGTGSSYNEHLLNEASLYFWRDVCIALASVGPDPVHPAMDMSASRHAMYADRMTAAFRERLAKHHGLAIQSPEKPREPDPGAQGVQE